MQNLKPHDTSKKKYSKDIPLGNMHKFARKNYSCNPNINHRRWFILWTHTVDRTFLRDLPLVKYSEHKVAFFFLQNLAQ